MKISYAITVCNEYEEIQRLISTLMLNMREEDEVVVLFDEKNGTANVWGYLKDLEAEDYIKLKSKPFGNHFADWKNYLNNLCTGDFIFQIDADEIPHQSLLEHLPEILTGNPNNEVYLVPRVNTVEGITDEHISKWRWNVDDKGWVNFPDYQTRIYKNDPRVRWHGAVHEKIIGHNTFAAMPAESEWCLIHHKDIARQEKQNNYYATI